MLNKYKILALLLCSLFFSLICFGVPINFQSNCIARDILNAIIGYKGCLLRISRECPDFYGLNPVISFIDLFVKTLPALLTLYGGILVFGIQISSERINKIRDFYNNSVLIDRMLQADKLINYRFRNSLLLQILAFIALCFINTVKISSIEAWCYLIAGLCFLLLFCIPLTLYYLFVYIDRIESYLTLKDLDKIRLYNSYLEGLLKNKHKDKAKFQDLVRLYKDIIIAISLKRGASDQLVYQYIKYLTECYVDLYQQMHNREIVKFIDITNYCNIQSVFIRTFTNNADKEKYNQFHTIRYEGLRLVLQSFLDIYEYNLQHNNIIIVDSILSCFDKILRIALNVKIDNSYDEESNPHVIYDGFPYILPTQILLEDILSYRKFLVEHYIKYPYNIASLNTDHLSYKPFVWFLDSLNDNKYEKYKVVYLKNFKEIIILLIKNNKNDILQNCINFIYDKYHFKAIQSQLDIQQIFAECLAYALYLDNYKAISILINDKPLDRKSMHSLSVLPCRINPIFSIFFKAKGNDSFKFKENISEERYIFGTFVVSILLMVSDDISNSSWIDKDSIPNYKSAIKDIIGKMSNYELFTGSIFTLSIKTIKIYISDFVNNQALLESILGISRQSRYPIKLMYYKAVKIILLFRHIILNTREDLLDIPLNLPEIATVLSQDFNDTLNNQIVNVNRYINRYFIVSNAKIINTKKQIMSVHLEYEKYHILMHYKNNEFFTNTQLIDIYNRYSSNNTAFDNFKNQMIKGSILGTLGNIKQTIEDQPEEWLIIINSSNSTFFATNDKLKKIRDILGLGISEDDKIESDYFIISGCSGYFLWLNQDDTNIYLVKKDKYFNIRVKKPLFECYEKEENSKKYLQIDFNEEIYLAKKKIISFKCESGDPEKDK